MRVKQLKVAQFALVLTVSGGALAYEEPDFSVVATVNGVEFRQYAPYLVAETTVVGEDDRDKATNVGFRRLFSYISGDNVLRTEVRSAAAENEGTKIAMTVPVQQVRQNDGWSISFVVPSEFDQDNVPLPADSNVQIRSVRGSLMAVLQYSGRWSDENVESHKAELLSRLQEVSVAPQGAAVTAYYNAPFSLPFMRRNEVMVAVGRVPVSPLSGTD